MAPYERKLGRDMKSLQLSNREIESLLPECYSKKKKPYFFPWLSDMSKFEEKTLFYIFYNVPGDLYQTKAAQEL